MMDGIKVGGGAGGGVGGGGDQEDMAEGSMRCSDHPYRNSNPGGICAFCLQEKLGKLVSSSFPIAIFPSSSSSSPSFRSEVGGFGHGGNASVGAGAGAGASSTSLSLSLSVHHTTSSSHHNNGKDCHYHHEYYVRRARIPFLLSQKKKKKKEVVVTSSDDHNSIILKRSKSTTTPRRGHFLDGDDSGDHNYSPHKRGFWSFLYLTKSSTAKRIDKNIKEAATTTTTTSALSSAPASTTNASYSQKAKGKDLGSGYPRKGGFVDENESPNSHSLDRKVSRSRSVGCGSRSFSGDFFERISTGFGDCTLRRVESQREGKPKSASMRSSGNGTVGGENHQCIKERVKCGGLFGGFIMTSSSSSSSSSSYWMSSSAEDMNGKATAAAGPLAHGRSKSWGWAFASPIRAFSKPSSNKDGKTNKNTTPNLSAIPSLLAVRG